MKKLIVNNSNDYSFDKKVRKARALIINEDNMIYVCNMNDSFLLPGGTIEKDEKPDETIIRELKEELGIMITNPKPLFEISYYHSAFPQYNAQGYERRLNIVTYYIKRISKSETGNNNFTDYEKKNNIKIELLSLDDLIKLCSDNNSKNKYSKFNNIELLELIKKFIKKSEKTDEFFSL